VWWFAGLCVFIGRTRVATADGIERPWNEDVIYFVLTDRFMDGDHANNVPEGSDPSLHDPSQNDIDRYHGGDFRGLEQAIQRGYFNDLGITALWITPPLRNAWFSLHDLGGDKTGYHGYWAQNFLDIDPHLVSAKRMDGTPYPQGRDGRMLHYRDLIDLAHENGIKIVQDIVCNHVGPLFYYDKDGDQHFDVDEKQEWIRRYVADGFYVESRWADIPAWNLRRTEPGDPQQILGHHVGTTGLFQNLDVYGRKGFSESPSSLGQTNGEEVTCDFFALRDFWTHPNSPFFDDLIDEFVEIYHFYVRKLGIDGLRVDTVKHVHHEFWDEFTERVRQRLGVEASRLIMFGEVYDARPRELGRFTYRTDFPADNTPCMDSLLNFQFCHAVREYLRNPERSYGPADGLEKMVKDVNAENPGGADRPYYNPTPGPDGLNARQKLVNFIGNHDGLNRFLVQQVDVKNHRLAIGLAMTMEGIPCVYYGSEAELRDNQGTIGPDTESGRLTYCRGGGISHLDNARQTDTFKTLESLAGHRRTLPALTRGRTNSLWKHNPQDEKRADAGIFAFARYIENENSQVQTEHTVVIVVNAHPDRSGTTGYDNKWMRLISHRGEPLISHGDRLVWVPVEGQYENAQDGPSVEIQWHAGLPHAKTEVDPKTISLFEVERP